MRVHAIVWIIEQDTREQTLEYDDEWGPESGIYLIGYREDIDNIGICVKDDSLDDRQDQKGEDYDQIDFEITMAFSFVLVSEKAEYVWI